MAILIPAYLKLCECGRHGHFVLSNGTRSQEFCSREAAREELENQKEAGQVTTEEVVFLRDSINKADRLVASDADANSLTLFACHLANEAVDAEEDNDLPPQYTVH